LAPVGEHDHVEGDVVHAAAGGLDDALDGFQHMAGLRGGVADVDHVVVLVERQCAGNVDHAIGHGAWNVRGERFAGAGGDDGLLGHVVDSLQGIQANPAGTSAGAAVGHLG